MNKEEAKRQLLEKLKAKLIAIDKKRDEKVLKIIKDREEAELKKIQTELKQYE